MSKKVITVQEIMANVARNASSAPSVKEVTSCAGCTACCRGMYIPLSPEEHAFLVAGGTELSPCGEYLTTKDRLRHWLGKACTQYYAMTGACGYLVEEDGQGYCGIYESDQRPEICRTFVCGGWSCRQVRARKGVDTPEEFADFDAATRE